MTLFFLLPPGSARSTTTQHKRARGDTRQNGRPHAAPHGCTCASAWTATRGRRRARRSNARPYDGQTELSAGEHTAVAHRYKTSVTLRHLCCHLLLSLSITLHLLPSSFVRLPRTPPATSYYSPLSPPVPLRHSAFSSTTFNAGGRSRWRQPLRRTWHRALAGQVDG